MPNPHISTQDWYYHAPSKRTTKSPKAVPPASQIPGIGGLKDEFANPESDERHFRRKWIRDTDSKYIKMAKGGGRKNLLTFSSPPTKSEEPVAYPRVDWFDHDHPEDELDESDHTFHHHEEQQKEPKSGYHVLPDWYVHIHDLPSDDVAVTGTYSTKRPIMGFDNLSKWQRDGKDANPNNVRLPPLKRIHKPDKRYQELVESQKNEPQRRQVRLPKIDSEPVNFKHLLSMGYQRDWFNEQGQATREERAEKKRQQKENEEKREEQQRNAIAMRKPKDASSNSDKPLFKLSRFEHAHPKVETFRT